MKNYTDKEIYATMNRAGLPNGLSFGQMIKISYWAMFDRKKLNKFCWNIERGMSILFAFKDIV